MDLRRSDRIRCCARIAGTMEHSDATYRHDLFWLDVDTRRNGHRFSDVSASDRNVAANSRRMAGESSVWNSGSDLVRFKPWQVSAGEGVVDRGDERDGARAGSLADGGSGIVCSDSAYYH